MGSRAGQYCITVSDLERSEAFYRDVIGLKVLQHISIPDAREVILGAEDSDGRIQLAQRTDVKGPIDHGNALWKLYVYCDDIHQLYDKAIAYGCESDMSPTELDEWPVVAAFIRDPDGYSIEVLQRI